MCAQSFPAASWSIDHVGMPVLGRSCLQLLEFLAQWKRTHEQWRKNFRLLLTLWPR